MSRIRNVKPEFLRHKEMQKLGPLTMLVFVGLWTQADKAGNFKWRPDELKLDILPFIEYDIEEQLIKLENNGFISSYVGEDGKEYGHVHNFTRHQLIGGSEIKSSPKHPPFPTSKNQEFSRSEKAEGFPARTPKSYVLSPKSAVQSTSLDVHGIFAKNANSKNMSKEVLWTSKEVLSGKFEGKLGGKSEEKLPPNLWHKRLSPAATELALELALEKGAAGKGSAEIKDRVPPAFKGLKNPMGIVFKDDD